MIYLLAYLLQGDAKEFHEGIISDLHTRFGIRKPYQTGIPPHITLKAPFEHEDIASLIKDLKDFSNKETSVPITLRHYGHFRRQVIFTRVQNYQQLYALQGRLAAVLNHHLPPRQWKAHDYPHVHYHVTLATGHPTKKRYEAITAYLEKQYPEPVFELSVDHLAILYHDGGEWKVHTLLSFSSREEV